MTTINTEEERAAFEAWAKDRHWNLRCSTGSFYISKDTEAGWQGWRGAVAASSASKQERVKLTTAEVRHLTAMVWGAPVGLTYLCNAVLPIIRAYEECQRRGERPKDPARGGRLSADAWRHQERTPSPDAPDGGA